MRWSSVPLPLVLVLSLTGFAVEEEGQHSDSMEFVGNIPYEARNGNIPNFGTDIEFGTLGGRELAFAGSYRNGLQIVDITRPERARRIGVYDCGVTQGDVQVFTRDDIPGRTFVTYTSDTVGDGTSTCYREAAALGFDVLKPDGRGKNGTFIADVTNPRKPRTVAFVEVAQGSHNMTVHPSGRYLYNSNSDLITSFLPAIEVYDITDIRRPELATELALPTRPGLGTESHDITFNEDGSRAYSAALSQGVIIDTTDPAAPTVVSSFLDPAINVWHQSDPVTIGDREFLIVEDEVAGALPTAECPSGGVHVYEITGDLERNPAKVGFWNISDVGPTQNGAGTCTAHVFDIHEDAQVMTIAFYNGGVRVVDISGLEGISIGEDRVVGEGMREVGFYRFADSDTWSAKTPRIEPDGGFYLYGNDIERGLDIYRFTGSPQEAPTTGGVWMTPDEAAAWSASLPDVDLASYELTCLLPR